MYGRYPMGQIEVICGSMFSGKSEELIRRITRARIARQRIQVFKPKIDTRSGDNTVTSHSSLKIQAHVVESSDEILRDVDDRTDIVGIDEVQFFDRGIVDVVFKKVTAAMVGTALGKDAGTSAIEGVQEWKSNSFNYKKGKSNTLSHTYINEKLKRTTTCAHLMFH